MAYETAAPLLATTPVNASGVGSAVFLGVATALDQTLLVQGLTGTGTITIGFEASFDGVSFATVLPTSGSISAITANGFTPYKLVGLPPYVRVKWTVAGTVSATLQLTGSSKIVYATPAMALALGLPPSAYGQTLDATTQANLLESASDEADAKIRMSNTLPLKAWGLTLTQKVVDIYVYLAMKRRGVNPEPGAYDPFQAAATAARKWLTELAAGEVDAGIIDSSADQAEGAPLVTTNARRGW